MKNFAQPELNVVHYSVEDVITTSPLGGGTGSESGGTPED